MTIRLNLKQRLLLVLGLIALVVLSISIINYKILKAEQEDILTFGKWSDIDMIMNENVLAKFANLKTAFLYWKDNPTNETWNQVEDAFTQAKEGLYTWSEMISNEAKLSKKVMEWNNSLEEIRKIIFSCKKFQYEREKNIEKVLNYDSNLRNLLENIMENVIHPAKEKALYSKNIKLFALMSDIDMIMNEDIIEPFLDFELALHSYILGKKSSVDVENAFLVFKKGLDKWTKLVKGYPDFENAALNISNLANNVSKIWLEIKNDTENLNRSTSLLMKKITSLNKEANSIMDEVVNLERSKVFSEVLINARKNIRFSLIEVGTVLILIALVAFGTRRTYKPLIALIARLKDLAVGETDLTKQLKVKTINCSQVTQCNNLDCPVYGKESHCWYEAGSYAPVVYCPKIKKGIYSSCEECKVYKQAIVTEIDEVSTFVNAFIRRVCNLVIKVKKQAETVIDAARELATVSEQLSSAAENTQLHVEKINQVANITAESMASVATAIKEMNNTIKEIAEHTISASQIAQEAGEETTKAQEVIKNLSLASGKIGEISKLIGSIADQTKLLALNASIEAARAGEAGKGFTVVANEVKELAQQTGNSVTDIETMVKDLQGDVGQALEAMDKISSVIYQVVELSKNIADAIEEQTAMTNRVSESSQKVNEEVNDIANMSRSIYIAGEQTAQVAERLRGTAHKLRSLSDELKNLLDEFKT